MRIDQERLDDLTVAALSIAFRRTLKRGGWTSLGWGLFACVIDWYWLQKSDAEIHFTNQAYLATGILLALMGVYQLHVQKPHVLRYEASLLGLLALLNIITTGVGWYSGKSWGVHLFIGIMQALWAYTMYYQYHVYAAVHENAQPVLVAYVDDLIHETIEADPRLQTDIVEFEISEHLEDVEKWRVL